MRLPTPPVDLCKSVQSVGELFWLRGVYHPTEQTGRGCSPTDFTDSHRWLVALVAAWVRQDAIPSYICVNLCYLWETLLYKKLLWVPCVLWEYSSPTDFTDSHRWLGALVAAWVRQDAIPSYKASVRSVGSVGVPLLAWLVQQRQLHPLRLHQCHLWKSLLSKKFLCVLWVLWKAIP